VLAGGTTACDGGAANASTSTSGAGGLYPIEALGLIVFSGVANSCKLATPSAARRLQVRAKTQKGKTPAC